ELGTRLDASLVVEPHREENPHGFDAVAPRDLLSLRVRPPVVRDRKLVHAQLSFRDLRRNLGLDRKIVLPQVQRTQNVRTESLVARFHVGERRVEENVREQAEEAVSDQVPEEIGALWFSAREAGTEDHVGGAAKD